MQSAPRFQVASRNVAIVLALAALQLTVFVLDVIQPEIVLFGYLNLPVVLSIGLGRPRLTGLFAASAVMLGLITAEVNGYFLTVDGWVRLLLMSAICGISLALTFAVERVRTTRDRDAALLREEHVRLQAAEARFRLLATGTSNVILQVGSDGIIEWASPSIEATMGWMPQDLVGVKSPDLVHPDDLLGMVDPEAADAGRGPTTLTFRARCGDGSYLWVEAVSDRITSPADGWITRLRRVEEEVQRSRQLQYLADRDPLTGLFNRRGAQAQVDVLLTERRANGPSAVMFLDVDSFKEVNDLHGHAVGDTVLRTMGERVSSLVRDSDVVARPGGDELLVIMTGVGDGQEATRLAERIRRHCGEPIDVGEEWDLVTTVSIGLAVAHRDEDIHHVMRRADDALYLAKDGGRNNVQVAAD